VGYLRYADDILLIYNTQQTNIREVLDRFNKINPKLQFTLGEEENNALHFLEITIYRTDNNIQFSNYRKPTTTDTIIPYDSCHPAELKLSAVRYLRNRNETYLLTPDSKQKETKIINHILQTNKYNNSFGTGRNRAIDRKEKTDPRNRKWTKFTYTGQEVRSITKLFKHTNIQITFTTNNNLGKLLAPRRQRHNTEIYKRSGVYRLTCQACNKRYIGQTVRSFYTSYKEHAQDYKQYNRISYYA
jgi:hypothetical protein